MRDHKFKVRPCLKINNKKCKHNKKYVPVEAVVNPVLRDTCHFCIVFPSKQPPQHFHCPSVITLFIGRWQETKIVSKAGLEFKNSPPGSVYPVLRL